MASPPRDTTYISKSCFDHISETNEARNLIFGTFTPLGTDFFSDWTQNFILHIKIVSVNHSAEGVLLEI